MNEIKITKDSLENAILRDGQFVSGYVEKDNGHINASGYGAHAEGYSFGAPIDASGNGAHAEGIDTCALNDGAHAEGSGTYAGQLYAHAEGFDTSANGNGAHAEGYRTYAGMVLSDSGIKANNEQPDGLELNKIKLNSHFDVDVNILINNHIFYVESTEGSNDIIVLNKNISKEDLEWAKQNSILIISNMGDYAHAEGYETVATGNFSHASGKGTIANRAAMTAIGKYNISNSIYTTNTLFVIGNGTSNNNRSNAFVVKNNGDVFINPSNSGLLISLYDLIYRLSPHLIYTSSNNSSISPHNTNALPLIISNTYSNDYGIMIFNTSCSSIGDDAFMDSAYLKSVIIPNGVIDIGYRAFKGCVDLTSVTIPNSVTGIGEHAFDSCSSLASVTIPNSVIDIGDYAFYNCGGLISITCEAIKPPECRTGVFNNTGSSPIYVPADSVDVYKAAQNWSEYADRIQAIPE